MSHVLPAVDSIHNVRIWFCLVLYEQYLNLVMIPLGWHILSLFGITWWTSKGIIQNVFLKIFVKTFFKYLSNWFVDNLRRCPYSRDYAEIFGRISAPSKYINVPTYLCYQLASAASEASRY